MARTERDNSVSPSITEGVSAGSPPGKVSDSSIANSADSKVASTFTWRESRSHSASDVYETEASSAAQSFDKVSSSWADPGSSDSADRPATRNPVRRASERSWPSRGEGGGKTARSDSK